MIGFWKRNESRSIGELLRGKRNLEHLLFGKPVILRPDGYAVIVGDYVLDFDDVRSGIICLPESGDDPCGPIGYVRRVSCSFRRHADPCITLEFSSNGAKGSAEFTIR